jgi:hypothetical protein
MPDWMKVGGDIVVGAPVGVVDQIVQNQDEKRRRETEAAGTPFNFWKHYGTWYNYGVPVLTILGIAMNFLKGDWATRLMTAGSELAGRKVTYQMTKATQATPWQRYNPPGGGRSPVGQTPQKPEFHKVGIT